MLFSLNYSVLRNISKKLTKILNPIVSVKLQQQAGNFRILSTNTNNFARTHYCGNLSVKNNQENVNLCGWVQSTRFKNFLLLRDIKGIVQVCFDDDFLSISANLAKVAKINEESVVSISGTVRKRPEGQENPKMSTGFIEVKCKNIEIIGNSKSKLPFEINEFDARPNETLRLKYRYLDLRFLLFFNL